MRVGESPGAQAGHASITGSLAIALGGGLDPGDAARATTARSTYYREQTAEQVSQFQGLAEVL